MSVTRLSCAAVLGLTCLALAACGNAPGRDVTASTIAKGILAQVTGSSEVSAPDANTVAQQAAAALASSSGQVIVVSIPDRNAVAVMQEIERNGAYVTFGTADRRSITLKYGILTATRGLGNDLMSAEIEAVTRLIQGRREGAAARVNRYLDGENQTVALDPWCQTKLAGSSQVNLGEVASSTTRVLESCIADTEEFPDATFQNSYQVTPSGRIVESRQWVSPFNGYISIQSLR
jgi:hypothetical protein